MRWVITVKQFTYYDSLLQPEESKKNRMIFSVREFFIFKLKESHAPENVPETICCMYAPSHKQMFLMQFCSRSSTWVTVMSKCHLLVIVVGGIKTCLCFSVIWRKNLDKVSGTRRKNCQLLCGKSVQNPGECLWVYISFVKHLRAYIKRLEKFDDNTSTLYPIS